MKKGFAYLPLVVIIASVLAVGTVAYFAFQKPAAKTNVNSSVNLNIAVQNTNVGDQNRNTAISNTNVSVITNTTVDVTKDWKTYTNTTYSYSIKYPSAWSISEALGPKTIQIAPPDAASKTSPEQSPAVFIVADQTYQEHHYAYNNDPKTEMNSNWRTQTINGLTIKRQYQSGLSENDVAYFLTTSGKYIAISWDVGFVKDYPEYEQILSSFIFISPTAGWKTYTNTKWGFSFKYPATLKVTREDDFNGGFFVTVADTKATAGGGTTRSYEIDVRINPDGYSEYPYKTWTVERSTGKGFPVVKEVAGTVTNPNPSQIEVVAGESTALTGAKGYKVNFLNDSTVNKTTWETELKTFLSTFTFTK